MSEHEIGTEAGRTAEESLLLTYLQGHEVECPLCRYNLKGLTTPRCPECGKSLALRVGLVEQPLLPFIFYVIALVLPAGLGVVGWCVFLKEGISMYRFDGSAVRQLETWSLIGFQLSCVMAWLPLWTRRWFLRKPLRSQWVIVAMAAIEPSLLYGMFVASIVMRW